MSQSTHAALDVLLQRFASSGFDDALVSALRALANDATAWPAMRAFADAVHERDELDAEVTSNFATAVRAVCPPGAGWTSDDRYAQGMAAPLLFLQWLPGPRAIALRCVCLGALYVRSSWEHEHADGLSPRPTLPGALGAWLGAEGLRGELSPSERALFGKPAGTWTPDERFEASWRGEALGVLEWAIGLHESIPPVGETFSTASILAPLPLERDTSAFIAGARSPSEELDVALELSELWVKRTRARARGKQLLPPFVREWVEDGAREGFVTHTLEGDLVAFGRPYFRISDEEHATASLIAEQRHFAMRWLTGYGYSWDDTWTDT